MRKQQKRIQQSLLILCLAALLALSACLAQGDAAKTSTPANGTAATATAATAATAAATATTAATTTAAHGTSATTAPDPTQAVTAAAETEPTSQPSAGCGYHPSTAALVEQIQPEPWMAWIRQLSGAEPVNIGGETVTIETRFTPAMFDENFQPQPNARAFDYLLQTVSGWYPAEQIEVQSFTVTGRDEKTSLRGKNIILTLPGTSKAEEVVILSAHYDSNANSRPEAAAPGAEDNGTGTAALLEAARLFRDYRFERTIRIIWFAGEELGLLGSKAYVSSDGFDPSAVVGVINLDMFGYDSDGDRCFELHVGRLPASDRIGQCFLESARAYELGLERIDYLTSNAVGGSDHGSFWNAGVGAVEILENMFDHKQPQGCVNADPHPDYHTARDTHEKINPDSGIRIVRAALAAAAGLAGLQ